MRSANYILGFCLALLGLALLPLTGCGGAECGDGTIEQDGECVLEADLIECGQNSAEEEGACVADDPIECGDDTELDPNENRCVVTEEVCGANTAFSSEADRCVPTSEVCTEGTTFFDDETGLCLPEAQCTGDQVVVDGFCVTSADALAEDADVDADGNTNPAFDGTPVELPAKNAGEQTIFTGNIDAPADLDDDEELDQHVAYFEFDAQAGDWFEVAVHAQGIPNPAFMVYSAEADEHHLERTSPLGTMRNKSRQVVIPEDGTYYVAVYPEALLSGSTSPVGGEEWDFVGTLELLTPPDATTHSFEGGNVEGTLGDLTSNFFHVDEFDAEESIQLNWQSTPVAAEQVVSIWASPTELIGEYTSSSIPFEVPETGEFYLVFDWSVLTSLIGLDYEFAGKGLVELGPDETYPPVTVSASEGQVLVVEQNNGSDASVSVEVTDPNGDVVVNGSVEAEDDRLRTIGTVEGDYTVTFENTSGSAISEFIGLPQLVTPEPITDFGATYTGASNEADHIEQAFYSIELDETTGYRLTGTQTGGSGWLRLFVYGLDDNELARHASYASNGNSQDLNFEFEADTPYIIRVGNDGGGFYPFDFALNLEEVEVLGDGDSSDPLVVDAEAGDVIEAWQLNDDFAAMDITITDEAGDTIVDDSASDSEIIQALHVEAGEYTVTFTNTSGSSVFGVESDAVAISPIEATTFTADENVPVELEQSNDDSTTVTLVITDPNGDLFHSGTLSTSGTMSFSAEDAGEYTVTYFRSGQDPADQTVDGIDVQANVGTFDVLNDFDIDAAQEGASVRITQTNPEEATIGLEVVNTGSGDVVYEMESVDHDDMIEIHDMESGNYEVSAEILDPNLDSADVDVTVDIFLVEVLDSIEIAGGDVGATVDITQDNPEGSSVYLQVVHEGTGDVVYEREAVADGGTISVDDVDAGTYEVNAIIFDTALDSADVEVTFEIFPIIVLDTFTGEASDVVEITADSSLTSSVGVRLVHTNTETSYDFGELAFGSDDILRFHGLELDGEYNIVTTEDVDPADIDISVALHVPELIEDFDAVYEVSGFEANWMPQNYFLVELDETTTYELTIDNLMGATDGGVRIFIYEVNELLLETDEAFSFTPGGAAFVQSASFEFEADTAYVVRLGNRWDFGETSAYDAELTFEEQ